jgi:thiaminase/transcriptional activator TenA
LAFADELRAGARAAWDRITTHRFTEAIGDGTLSLARFRYFMRQDYRFLIDYARVLALASARAPDLESMSSFAGLLHETLNSEMALHRSFCADFGITERQLEATRPARATTAYTGFLVDTAREGGIAEISAVLLPCQWSYDEIGRRLEGARGARVGSFHRRWIDGYCSREYRSVTDWLVRFVDRTGSGANEKSRAAMHRLFRDSCRHELSFWEAAWRAGRG